MSFTTLTDEEMKELLRLSRFYWREARRCEKAKAYLAGCVMVGSALETLLILMINLYADEAEQTGKVPNVKGKPKPLMNWQLSELLRVAKAANWLPSVLGPEDRWSHKRARIGDYAEILRAVRNLAHPSRYVEDHFRKRVTATDLQRMFEVCLICRDWLAHRNKRALLEHLEAERKDPSVVPSL